jgi:F-type H+-transporting ATPase subunit epsilon
MATSDKQLQCVIVTPERAVLDEKAEFIVLPMIDGELGVQPGRAPLVGRLGKGELRLKQGAETKKLQIEGGFAQVRSDVITVLTTRVL